MPIPPRGDLTEGMSEVLETLAAHELTRYTADPETRRRLQPALLRQAIQDLERMAEQAALAPTERTSGSRKRER